MLIIEQKVSKVVLQMTAGRVGDLSSRNKRDQTLQRAHGDLLHVTVDAPSSLRLVCSAGVLLARAGKSNS